jgi:dihydroxyacetone kinase
MAGYVGEGMLAAAICGEVFASPSEDAVLAAIRAVTGPAGDAGRSMLHAVCPMCLFLQVLLRV